MAQKNVARAPSPPFTTSSMQQDAFNRLGFSPASTMQLAQRLYEGPEGSEGAWPLSILSSKATHSVQNKTERPTRA